MRETRKVIGVADEKRARRRDAADALRFMAVFVGGILLTGFAEGLLGC